VLGGAGVEDAPPGRKICIPLLCDGIIRSITSRGRKPLSRKCFACWCDYVRARMSVFCMQYSSAIP